AHAGGCPGAGAAGRQRRTARQRRPALPVGPAFGRGRGARVRVGGRPQRASGRGTGGAGEITRDHNAAVSRRRSGSTTTTWTTSCTAFSPPSGVSAAEPRLPQPGLELQGRTEDGVRPDGQ